MVPLSSRKIRKMKGHVKETCYKLIGYPQDKSKKNGYGNIGGSQGQYTYHKQNTEAAYNVL